MSTFSHADSLGLHVDNWQPSEVLRRAMDTFSDPIFIKDRQHRWVAGNAAFFTLFSLPAEKVLGKSDPDFFPKEQAEAFWRGDEEIFQGRLPTENEERLTDGDGTVRIIWTRKYPIFDEGGEVRALSGIITDVTRIRGAIEKGVRLEAEVKEQQRVIAAQSELLSQLSVPVIQIWKGILLVPLIGEISAARGMQIMQDLLEAITRHRAQFVLVDITGVSIVDTKVAGHLLQTVEATRLLGCQAVLVGVAAGVAAQMVKLGADFSALLTLSTLQQGLEFAMKKLSFEVISHAKKR